MRADGRADVRRPAGSPSPRNTKERVVIITSMEVNNETARDRLGDIRELEPTSNSELRDRWGMDTTKDVARYLREELGEYTYRDNNSKIRANAAEPDTTDGTPEEPDTPTLAPTGSTSTSTSTNPTFGEREPAGGVDDEPGADDEESGEKPPETHAPREIPRAERTGETAAQTDTSDTVTAPSSGSQTTDSDTSAASAASCPDCGDPLLDGEIIEASLREQAREKEATRRFIDANAGADPDRACRDVYGCGYYVEDGDPKHFDSPSSGWGRLLAGAGFGAAALAGAAKIAIKDGSDTGGPWDGV